MTNSAGAFLSAVSVPRGHQILHLGSKCFANSNGANGTTKARWRARNITMSDTEWPTVSPREQRIVLVPQSWHNRTGEVLRQISEDMWVMERGYIFLKTIDVGGRTTIIRLPDGGLFVHAPLALTKVVKRCIDEIGQVSVVVAPNTEHVDFIAQWKTFYPDACYLGPPTSKPRLPAVPFDEELSSTNQVHPKLEGAGISQFYIACAPFFHETVFIHQPTKSLLCTDFFWAYPSDPDVPRPTRAFAWGMNRIYKPIYDRILVTDRQQFVSTLQDILDSSFEQIIPCHGDIVQSGGHERLQAFFSEMLSA